MSRSNSNIKYYRGKIAYSSSIEKQIVGGTNCNMQLPNLLLTHIELD